MNVLLVVNPRSGRGRGAKAAAEIEPSLRAAGHRVHSSVVGRTETQEVLTQLDTANIAVAIGGDGTVQYLAGLIASPTAPLPHSPALYHVPTGNENLFARDFGMTRDPAQLVAALAEPDIRSLDLAHLSGTQEDGTAWARPVLLMAGFSVDAGVIERLHATRRRATGHLMYLRPAFGELLAPSFPRQTVSVAGREIVTDARGMLMIANCGRYATRLDPCHAARMDDGLLDVAFMPCRNVAGVLAWYVRCWRGRQGTHPGFVHATAPEVTVDFPEPTPCQIDGEALGFRVRGRVTMRCEPGLLRVLVPERERRGR